MEESTRYPLALFKSFIIRPYKHLSTCWPRALLQAPKNNIKPFGQGNPPKPAYPKASNLETNQNRPKINQGTNKNPTFQPNNMLKQKERKQKEEPNFIHVQTAKPRPVSVSETHLRLSQLRLGRPGRRLSFREGGDALGRLLAVHEDFLGE